MREVMTEAQKPGVPKRGHRAAIASDGRCVRGMAGGVNKKKTRRNFYSNLRTAQI